MELEPNIENGKNPRMLWQPFCMISFSRIRIILIKCIDNYPKSIHINVTINQRAIRTTLIWCSTYIKYWQVSKKKKNIFSPLSVSLFLCFVSYAQKWSPVSRSVGMDLDCICCFPSDSKFLSSGNLHFYNKTKTVFHVSFS